MELKSLDSLFYKSLGNEISNIRRSKGISLKELSEELLCSQQMVDKYELGKSRISPMRFYKICNYLGINPEIEVTVKLKKGE